MQTWSVSLVEVLIFSCACMILLITLDINIQVCCQKLEGGSGGGGGGGSDVVRLQTRRPLAPSPSQVPFLFADVRLAVVYPVIQKFKNLITSDPLNITGTWFGPDICNYKGFYCDSPPDNKSAIALASIDFNGFRLSAPTLDGFLDQLPDIAVFHANSNRFSGTISPNISKLPYLYEFDISNNLLSGPFPTAILYMSGLSFLDIRFNFFTGTVPPQLFAKDLDVLFINNNNFLTRLPDSIGNAHVLYLTLANNKFFGPIPRSIFRIFSSLSEILLLNNLLSGCLPYEIGLLEKVVLFDAGKNLLTGPLPFSLGCLRNLEILNFAGNLLYGNVPDVLCSLGNLANLSLSDNYFTQVGPFCWKLIENGVLDMRKNCIPGLPLQRSVAECAAFFARPRYCPYAATYVHMPCWFPHSNSAPLALSELPPSPLP
ncbi:putative inactive receptor kinase [Dorcoceras hygrometricum]|uniref:Putative inactive receptor kinase n=1 Tax=Dorcoceras hygrometricum TaxID=472368 RepID=A0A2Z7D5Z0_9LAMI|nr:putative inactive receptor kinase [Dorcoceras hygrometricum]